MILVDSNILIDFFSRDPVWAIPSRRSLAEASVSDTAVINQIVVAELAPQFLTLDEFLGWISAFDLSVEDLTNEAAYLGGKAFLEHRQRRRTGEDGNKSIIADFLIGGHAHTLGASILTRDPRFYRAYFPSVPLITPEENDQ